MPRALQYILNVRQHSHVKVNGIWTGVKLQGFPEFTLKYLYWTELNDPGNMLFLLWKIKQRKKQTLPSADEHRAEVIAETGGKIWVCLRDFLEWWKSRVKWCTSREWVDIAAIKSSGRGPGLRDIDRCSKYRFWLYCRVRWVFVMDCSLHPDSVLLP